MVTLLMLVGWACPTSAGWTTEAERLATGAAIRTGVRQIENGAIRSSERKALTGAGQGIVQKEIGRLFDKVAKLSRGKHPETAAHITDAQAAGKPSILTIDRPGTAAQRQISLRGQPKVPNKDLDEYPPAMFKEGGSGASVRPISPRDNRGAGACIGNQCRPLPNGARVKIEVTD
jgi:hypothetical protein